MLELVADRSVDQLLELVADRSVDQLLGISHLPLTLPMRHTPRALIGGAISDYRVNGYNLTVTRKKHE